MLLIEASRHMERYVSQDECGSCGYQTTRQDFYIVFNFFFLLLVRYNYQNVFVASFETKLYIHSYLF